MATLRQAAILCGGLGTRLGALTATTPKPLLPAGDRPFIAWVIRELMRFGVTDVKLLTGHLADAVQDALPAIRRTLPAELRIECIEEPVPAGTGGALRHAAASLDASFLLCNGDSLLDANLARMLAEAAADGPDVTGRIVLRALPDASRYGVVMMDGDRVTDFAERPPPGSPGLINAGIYRLDRRVAESVEPVCSLERDVLPALARAGWLRGTVLDGYFIDIGVPDDFARAQTEVPARLGNRPALFLDRDGVINVDHGWVGTRDRWEWNGDAREAIAYATDAGWHVFVVTNQSGVARGHYGEEDVRALHAWMADAVRAACGTVDDVRYCPFHPEGTVPAYARVSDWRKPAPGMILDLLRAWQVSPDRAVLIGDQPTDLATAAAAGIASVAYTGGSVLSLVRQIISDGPPST